MQRVPSCDGDFRIVRGVSEQVVKPGCPAVRKGTTRQKLVDDDFTLAGARVFKKGSHSSSRRYSPNKVDGHPANEFPITRQRRARHTLFLKLFENVIIHEILPCWGASTVGSKSTSHIRQLQPAFEFLLQSGWIEGPFRCWITRTVVTACRSNETQQAQEQGDSTQRIMAFRWTSVLLILFQYSECVHLWDG